MCNPSVNGEPAVHPNFVLNDDQHEVMQWN